MELTFITCPRCGCQYTYLTRQGICVDCLEKEKQKELVNQPKNSIRLLFLNNKIWGKYFSDMQKKKPAKFERFVRFISDNFSSIPFLESEFKKMEFWLLTADERKANKKAWERFIRNWLSKCL